jgi:hypothetical protein
VLHDDPERERVQARAVGAAVDWGGWPRNSIRASATRDLGGDSYLSRPANIYAPEARLPGTWFRWVALAPQCPMSSSAASATQNQSQPLSPRPGVYSSR